MKNLCLENERKLNFSFNSAEQRNWHSLYKTLKWRAIHFPKLAHSGFNNMGWASLLYLHCCIFKAAILNQYIFHCHETRQADKAVVNSLRVKIGKVPRTRYVADHQATCFFLTSPLTTNYVGLCVCPCLIGKSQNSVAELNWKITAWLQWPHRPAVWRCVHVVMHRGIPSVSTQIGQQHRGMIKRMKQSAALT